MGEETDLSPDQLGAIKRSILLGRLLQRDLGEELKGFYTEGGSTSQAIEKFGIESRYGVTRKIAYNGICYAIRGLEGEFQGLIPDEEQRRDLVEEHYRSALGRLIREKIGIFGLDKQARSKIGRDAGIANLKKKLGIHSLSFEEIRTNAIKGGRESYYQGKGIHALSTGRRKELGRYVGINYGREGGRRSSLSRGEVLWSYEEIKLAYDLAHDPDFRKGSRINNILIAQSLNGLLHGGQEIRTADSVYARRYLYEKSKDIKRTKCRPLPWTEDERKTARMLSTQREYRFESGRNKGKINAIKIRNKLVEIGYSSRTSASIQTEIRRFKNSLI